MPLTLSHFIDQVFSRAFLPSRTPWFLCVLLALIVFLPSVAVAGPIEDAREAIDNDDYLRAYSIVAPLADKGIPEVQYDLGQIFVGKATPEYAEAKKWYLKAAEKGYPPALYVLGEFFQPDHPSTAADRAEMVRWRRKAADYGYTYPAYQLGEMYEFGRGGVNQDSAEAARWYQKAADRGYRNAQEKLALMYKDGRGVKQDYELAYFWWKLSSTRNPALLDEITTHLTFWQRSRLTLRISQWSPLPDTMTNLPPSEAWGEFGDLGPFLLKSRALLRSKAESGDPYAEYWAISRTPAERTEWLSKSANHGYWKAQWALGDAYRRGDGVAKNNAEAFFWYMLSGKSLGLDPWSNPKALMAYGSSTGAFNLTYPSVLATYSHLLSPDEFNAVKRRVNNWRLPYHLIPPGNIDIKRSPL